MSLSETRAVPFLSASASLAMLFFTAVAVVLALCAIPRLLAPTELFALHLSREQVQAQLADDARQARLSPHSPFAAELARLVLAHGEAETRGSEMTENYLRRRSALRAAYQRLVADAGEPAALAMRARAVEQLEAALDLRLPQEQLTAVMGVFANALAAHGAVRDGEEVVPHFVTRTLYKARWNLAVGLPAAHAFAPVERRAFHGFLALHAENLPLPARQGDLERYAAAGGVRYAEARGVLAFRAHDYSAAVQSFERAYEKSQSLRLRNYLLTARLALAASAP